MLKKQKESVERLAFSIKEVSKRIGVCQKTIRDLIKAGKIKSSRAGDRVLISLENLNKFLNNTNNQ